MKLTSLLNEISTKWAVFHWYITDRENVEGWIVPASSKEEALKLFQKKMPGWSRTRTSQFQVEPLNSYYFSKKPWTQFQ